METVVVFRDSNICRNLPIFLNQIKNHFENNISASAILSFQEDLPSFPMMIHQDCSYLKDYLQTVFVVQFPNLKPEYSLSTKYRKNNYSNDNWITILMLDWLQ